jgi:hypothetical protein
VSGLKSAQVIEVEAQRVDLPVGEGERGVQIAPQLPEPPADVTISDAVTPLE